jgi:cytochrome c-type biogenesis protein CcmF
MLSRETAFLFNNLLFAAFTFTVLLGTLFPLVVEAANGSKVSVGAPFFNRMTLPLCAALLFLLGVGPMLPWRAARTDQLRRESVPPMIAFVVAVILAWIANVRSFYAFLGFGFAAFALVANVQQFVVATAARRRAAGPGVFDALWSATNANPRRYGGYIAHLGVVIVALGIAASISLRQEHPGTLKRGEALPVGSYTVRFDSLYATREPHRDVVGGVFTVSEHGREVGTLQPRLNYYISRPGEAIASPGVRSRFDDDLYLVLTRYTPPTSPEGETASINAIVEPWVSWIWFGGLVVALGSIFAGVPRRRDRAVADQQDIGGDDADDRTARILATAGR